MKKNLKTKFLSSRVFIIMGICLLVFIGFSLGKETYRNYQIEKEIQALEEEISNLAESYMKRCEDVIRSILELRKRFYTSS